MFLSSYCSAPPGCTLLMPALQTLAYTDEVPLSVTPCWALGIAFPLLLSASPLTEHRTQGTSCSVNKTAVCASLTKYESNGVKHRASPLSQPPQGSGLFLPDHLILEKLGFHLSNRSQVLLVREVALSQYISLPC